MFVATPSSPWISSNLVFPSDSSRRTSRVHRSPRSESVRAMEQFCDAKDLMGMGVSVVTHLSFASLLWYGALRNASRELIGGTRGEALEGSVDHAGRAFHGEPRPVHRQHRVPDDRHGLRQRVDLEPLLGVERVRD